MKKPNFFLVGAPKCGTTALSEYLRAHPNCFVSWPKEPHYFAENLGSYRRIETYDDYVSLFSSASESHLAVGEASVWYLYSPIAIRNIYEFNSQAKIVVMLRNPVDVVQSLHSQLLNAFIEDKKDFETAWRLQALRKEGKEIPSTCLEESFLQYAQAGKFGDQIERLYGVFPREQVKVVLLEDFARSTREVYEETLTFLGVPLDGRTEFPRIMSRREIKVEWLGKIMIYKPFPFNWIERKTRDLLKVIGIREFGLWHKILDMNTKNVSPKPLRPDFRRELIEEFKEDIRKLSNILGRDLKDWTT